MESIWMKEYIDKKLPSINEDISTPVLIIGGGIAGLMCAYNLMKKNIKFILVDSNKLASGVSANTTAQVSIAHDKLYDDIHKKHGKKKAIAYLKSQTEGLNLIKDIIKNENIECDYKEESTILCADEKKNIKTLDNQYQIIKSLSDINLLGSQEDVINYKKAIGFNSQFIFNPMKYMMSIIDILMNNNISLYENSKVTKIKKREDNYEILINDRYKIKAKRIIMACHYPFLNPDNLYFSKIYQSKSYAIAFKSKLKLKANYISLDKPYYYLRTYDDSTIIIGGSDHFTGIDIDIDKIKRVTIVMKNLVLVSSKTKVILMQVL